MGGRRGSGDLINAPSGTITASGSGATDAVIALKANSRLTGSVLNEGTISGAHWGISVLDSTITGTIYNQGPQSTISGNDKAIYLRSNASVSRIINEGTISSYYQTIHVDGHLDGTTIPGSTVSNGLTNTGVIRSDNDVGLKIEGLGTHVGPIVNTTRVNGGTTYVGTISGEEGGIEIRNKAVVDSIANSGRISFSASSSNDFGAIYVRNATISGAINNSGTISGLNTYSYNAIGLWLDEATVGSITNSGTISALNTASADSALGVWIQSGSTITGGITNSGLISGGYGLEIDGSTIVGGIHNEGGKIIGSVSSGLVFAGTTVTGGITNTGTISGDTHGIVVNSNSRISGGIHNNSETSTISGANSFGVRITSNSTVTGGLTNSGTISGGSKAILVDGTSSLDSIVISGNNTAKFIGAVDAPNTPVTVASGATYSMDNGQQFTVSGFTNAGTLKVGAGNTGTITGNFTNTGTFSPSITDNNTYGKLRVNGNVTLGGTLAANNGVSVSGLNAGTLNGVITYTGTRTNSFASVVGANSLFTWSAFNDDANKEIDLVLAAGSSGTGGAAGYLDAVVTAGQTPATGVGTVLDQIAVSNPTNPVVLSFVNVPQAQVANAVTQTLPLLTGGSQIATSAALTGINRVIQARQDANRGLSSGDSFYGNKHLWAKPFGSWADQSDRKGVSGYKSRSGGIAFGVDGTISNATRLGASFAYAKASTTGNSTVAPNSAGVDVYQLIGYGSHALDPDTEINFQAGVGQNRNHGRRQLTAFGLTASASYTSLTATAGAGIGRSYKLNDQTSFTPSVRADYTWIKDKAYAETGAGALNLNVQGRKSDELILAVDGKLVHETSPGTSLSANLGLGYDVLSKQAKIDAVMAGAPGFSFPTYGLDPSPWMLRGGLGVTSKTQGGMELTARYDIEHRQGFNNQTLSAKLRWAF